MAYCFATQNQTQELTSNSFVYHHQQHQLQHQHQHLQSHPVCLCCGKQQHGCECLARQQGTRRHNDATHHQSDGTNSVLDDLSKLAHDQQHLQLSSSTSSSSAGSSPASIATGGSHQRRQKTSQQQHLVAPVPEEGTQRGTTLDPTAYSAAVHTDYGHNQQQQQQPQYQPLAHNLFNSNDWISPRPGVNQELAGAGPPDAGFLYPSREGALLEQQQRTAAPLKSPQSKSPASNANVNPNDFNNNTNQQLSFVSLVPSEVYYGSDAANFNPHYEQQQYQMSLPEDQRGAPNTLIEHYADPNETQHVESHYSRPIEGYHEHRHVRGASEYVYYEAPIAAHEQQQQPHYNQLMVGQHSQEQQQQQHNSGTPGQHQQDQQQQQQYHVSGSSLDNNSEQRLTAEPDNASNPNQAEYFENEYPPAYGQPTHQHTVHHYAGNLVSPDQVQANQTAGAIKHQAQRQQQPQQQHHHHHHDHNHHQQQYPQPLQVADNSVISKRPKPRSRRGRPRKRSGHAKISGKLWEFIRDLLLSDSTNPSFIRWERHEDGVFKFVQSDKVAKMWGERKQNPKMTYEKLSRAMRYYYKSKVLLPVFGRRLVYKFGPNATGWLSPASAGAVGTTLNRAD